MNDIHPPEQLLPLGPTARLLHVEARWLRAEAEANRIPHVRAGGRLLFLPSLVQKALLLRLQNGQGEASHD